MHNPIPLLNLRKINYNRYFNAYNRGAGEGVRWKKEKSKRLSEWKAWENVSREGRKEVERTT